MDFIIICPCTGGGPLDRTTGGGCWVDLSLENHSSRCCRLSGLSAQAEAFWLRAPRRTNLFRILPLTFVWGEVFKCQRRHLSPVLNLLLMTHTGRNRWTNRSLILVHILSPGLICSTEFLILSLFLFSFYSIMFLCHNSNSWPAQPCNPGQKQPGTPVRTWPQWIIPMSWIFFLVTIFQVIYFL